MNKDRNLLILICLNHEDTKKGSFTKVTFIPCLPAGRFVNLCVLCVFVVQAPSFRVLQLR